MTVKIFISHATADQSLASALVDCLMSCIVLRDQEVRCTSVPGHKLPVGSEMATVLRDDLDASIVVLGLLTPNAVSSGWVLFELGSAWGAKKNPLPVLAGNLTFDDLPGPLTGHHAVSMADKIGMIQMIEEISATTGTQKRTAAKIDSALDKLVKAAGEYDQGPGRVSNAQPLEEISTLKAEIQKLRALLELAKASAQQRASDLAGLDEPITVAVKYTLPNYKDPMYKMVNTTWSEVFAIISPSLLERPNDTRVSSVLGKGLFDRSGTSDKWVTVKDQDFETIKVHLLALNLIRLDYAPTTQGGMALFWSLTEFGQALMIKLRAVRTAQKEDRGTRPPA